MAKFLLCSWFSLSISAKVFNFFGETLLYDSGEEGNGSTKSSYSWSILTGVFFPKVLGFSYNTCWSPGYDDSLAAEILLSAHFFSGTTNFD